MAKRKLQNCGRQRAIWGAVVPAVASLIGTAVGVASATKNQRAALEAQRKEQERLYNIQKTEAAAANLNNYFSTIDDEYDDYRYPYKNGGKRKLRNAAVITDGGYAIPVGKSTYLLQGSNHNKVNESGNTGIGIKAGNKEIEAENGEVIQNKGNELRIFSSKPILNGTSPADAVLGGVNPNYVFKAQENVKKRYKLRNGRSTPVERNKAAFGATFYTPDYIGLGTNILGSILSGAISRNAYKGLLKDVNYTLSEYVPETYVNGPTTYFNAAQRANVERNRLNARNIISQNTASASTALDLMQRSDIDALQKQNELWDTKANAEVKMRQANAERAQLVRARNAAARNQYYKSVADIRNEQLNTRLGLRKAMSDSNVEMIQGIGSSIGNFLQQGVDNYQDRQNRIALLAGAEKGTLERLASLGYDVNPEDARIAYMTAMNEKNLNRDDVGAQQRYDFWRNYFAYNRRFNKDKYRHLRLSRVPGLQISTPTVTFNPTISLNSLPTI